MLSVEQKNATDVPDCAVVEAACETTSIDCDFASKSAFVWAILFASSACAILLLQQSIHGT